MRRQAQSLVRLRKAPSLTPTPSSLQDGTRVAFARQGNIYVASDDGSWPRRITSLFKTATRPVWSPDARRIAFYTAEGDDATIWTVDVNNAALPGRSQHLWV